MLLLSISLILLVSVQVTIESSPDCSPSVWNDFKVRYGKEYASVAENRKRHKIFCDNWRAVHEHNKSDKRTYDQGINEFSDLTYEEFAETHLGLLPKNRLGEPEPTSYLKSVLLNKRKPPEIADWSFMPHVVGPVRDQGACNGSSWAFSMVSLIEASQHRRYKNFTHKVIPLSVQQLIDCDSHSGNQGCQSGDPYKAQSYLKQFGGLQAESTYRFVSGKDTKKRACKAKQRLLEPASSDMIYYFEIERNNEKLMKRFVGIHGPILVGIYADFDAFRNYKKGVIFDPACRKGKKPTHYAMIVGYGHDDDTGLDYWKIKNSWGAEWGYNGYFKLARNQPEEGGHCGVASRPITTD